MMNVVIYIRTIMPNCNWALSNNEHACMYQSIIINQSLKCTMPISTRAQIGPMQHLHITGKINTHARTCSSVTQTLHVTYIQ